jgi:hypothetical protein
MRPVSSAPGERRGEWGAREIFIRLGHFLVDRQRVWIRPLPRGVLHFHSPSSWAVLISRRLLQTAFILGNFFRLLSVSQDFLPNGQFCEKGYHLVVISKDGILLVLLHHFIAKLPRHGSNVTVLDCLCKSPRQADH